MKSVSTTTAEIEAPVELAEQTAKIGKQIADACQALGSAEPSEKLNSLSAERQNILKVLLLNDGAIFKVNGKEVVPFLEPAARKRYDELAIRPAGGSPDIVDAMIKSEVARWSEVIRRADIKLTTH